jgi:peptide methionine sulfoxide reductase MsrB
MGCTQSSATEVSITAILNANPTSYPKVGPAAIMAGKGHGTYSEPVQKNLRFGCDFKTADRICNFNRHFAEHSGYFVGGARKAKFLTAVQEAKAQAKSITFYDSNTGKPLFTAPVNRTWDEWLNESKAHGWPSFRDQEVNWENVRTLRNGETVSIHGTHLGHNLPDGKGNRYCINLVSIAGNPVDDRTIQSAPENKE